MAKAYGTFTYRSNTRANSIIIDLDIPNGPGRSFIIDAGRNEPRSSLYNRAYSQSSIWAEQHSARLETFRAA